jgi:hypothetical protein
MAKISGMAEKIVYIYKEDQSSYLSAGSYMASWFCPDLQRCVKGDLRTGYASEGDAYIWIIVQTRLGDYSAWGYEWAVLYNGNAEPDDWIEGRSILRVPIHYDERMPKVDILTMDLLPFDWAVGNGYLRIGPCLDGEIPKKAAWVFKKPEDCLMQDFDPIDWFTHDMTFYMQIPRIPIVVVAQAIINYRGRIPGTFFWIGTPEGYQAWARQILEKGSPIRMIVARLEHPV